MEYKHSVLVQLRFNDVDGLGHVNNSVYFSFYDLGKTEYFKTINGGVIPDEIDIVVAHAEVDFIMPVYFTDEIAVQTTVRDIGNKSFELMQRIIDTKHNVVKCRCKTIMVGFDFKNNCSIPSSQKWRDAISAFEGVQF